MKKTNLIGMFALTFALVFGAVACSSGSSASSGTDLKEALKDKELSLKGDWDLTDCSWDEELGVAYEVSEDGDPAAIWDNYKEAEKPTEVAKKEDYIKAQNEKNPNKYDDDESAKVAFALISAMYDTTTMQTFADEEDKYANDNKTNGEGVTQKTEVEASAELDGDSSLTVTMTTTKTYTKGDDTYSVTTTGWEVWEKK